jgi:galactokinase
MTTSALTLDPMKKNALDAGFAVAFGGAPDRYFSAPGRTEIGGNHTDHQRGRVLAAAVNLDTVAAVRENGTDIIRILSKGYPLCEVDVKDLTPKEMAELGDSLQVTVVQEAEFAVYTGDTVNTPAGWGVKSGFAFEEKN